MGEGEDVRAGPAGPEPATFLVVLATTATVAVGAAEGALAKLLSVPLALMVAVGRRPCQPAAPAAARPLVTRSRAKPVVSRRQPVPCQFDGLPSPPVAWILSCSAVSLSTASFAPRANSLLWSVPILIPR